MTEELEKHIAIIKSHLGEFPDFPKKGILFRDLFTAIRNPEVCKSLKQALLIHIRENCPDVEVVVGLDARGFLFSLLIAAELGIACVPIRKKGKLPGECFEYKYSLEYGTESIKPGQKVLIVDDLIATGGSLNAAVKLIEMAGGKVVEALCIIELTALNGRKKVDTKVSSFIQYDD